MKSSVSYVMTETVVRKAIKDLKDNPERTIRNLVDMALHFSGNGFRQRFFAATQAMLKNENSPYYDLITDIVNNVESEKLITFGMNMGFNGCTQGAKIIRKNEEKGFNIPWTVLMEINSYTFADKEEKYNDIIRQGKELGIYNWMIFLQGQSGDVLNLAKNHPDCAFVLFIEDKKINIDLADCMCGCDNVMTVVKNGKFVKYNCHTLWNSGCLYSVYDYYDTKNKDNILSGDLITDIVEYHPAFTCFMPKVKCSKKTRIEIGNYIEQARNNQLYRTIVIDLEKDLSLIDSIISGDTCLAYFDSEGYLKTATIGYSEKEYNYFHNDLQSILSLSFSK